MCVSSRTRISDREFYLTFLFQTLTQDESFSSFVFLVKDFEKYRLTFTTNPNVVKMLEDVQFRKKMNSAVRLNEIIRERSSNADLVLINLPKLARRSSNGDEIYVEFVEQLCSSIFRCILVKGSGQEVMTIFS